MPIHSPRIYAQYNLDIIDAAVLLGACCIAFLAARYLLHPLRHVPGPWWSRITSFPVTSDVIKGRRIYRVEQLHHKYGPIVRIGPKEVSIADWRHIRTIYTEPKTMLKEPSFYAGATMVGKNNIFKMTNPTEHAARRKLSSPPYALASVARLDSLILKKAHSLVQRLVIEADASANGTADAYKLCGLFSFEVICQVALAHQFNEPDGMETALKMLRAMDSSAPALIVTSVFPFLRSSGLGAKLPGPIGNGYRSLIYWERQSRVMVDRFLEKSSEDNRYLISPIATGVDTFLGRRLNHEEIIEEAMSYMFAGSGTTSTTLTYLLYALALPENIHKQQRLREELRTISIEDVSALRQHPYLNAMIKETMRRYPTIVSTLPRVLTNALTFEGYLLPKGTVIGMQNWMHHRNPKVFPEPDRFLPERWLESNAIMEDSLTPFGVGRRNCIGQNLAWEELYIAVATIMWAGLAWTVGPEMEKGEMDIVDRFNIAPKGGRLMIKIKRE